MVPMSNHRWNVMTRKRDSRSDRLIFCQGCGREFDTVPGARRHTASCKAIDKHPNRDAIGRHSLVTYINGKSEVHFVGEVYKNFTNFPEIFLTDRLVRENKIESIVPMGVTYNVLDSIRDLKEGDWIEITGLIQSATDPNPVASKTTAQFIKIDGTTLWYRSSADQPSTWTARHTIPAVKQVDDPRFAQMSTYEQEALLYSLQVAMQKDDINEGQHSPLDAMIRNLRRFADRRKAEHAAQVESMKVFARMSKVKS